MFFQISFNSPVLLLFFIFFALYKHTCEHTNGHSLFFSCYRKLVPLSLYYYYSTEQGSTRLFNVIPDWCYLHYSIKIIKHLFKRFSLYSPIMMIAWFLSHIYYKWKRRGDKKINLNKYSGGYQRLNQNIWLSFYLSIYLLYWA